MGRSLLAALFIPLVASQAAGPLLGTWWSCLHCSLGLLSHPIETGCGLSEYYVTFVKRYVWSFYLAGLFQVTVARAFLHYWRQLHDQIRDEVRTRHHHILQTPLLSRHSTFIVLLILLQAYLVGRALHNVDGTRPELSVPGPLVAASEPPAEPPAFLDGPAPVAGAIAE